MMMKRCRRCLRTPSALRHCLLGWKRLLDRLAGRRMNSCHELGDGMLRPGGSARHVEQGVASSMGILPMSWLSSVHRVWSCIVLITNVTKHPQHPDVLSMIAHI